MSTPPNQPSSGRASSDDAPPFRYTAALADQIETRWQKHWDAEQTFRQPNPGEADFEPDRPKFYCLDMFPYPSGAGLHVGHPEGYTATDIVSRYKRMKGCNVLHPMGWDAFGLPAEQYAIQTGVHPATTTRKSIDTFRRQLKRFGFSYDWSREYGTIDPEYYKWTQWIFLRLYNSWFDPQAETPTYPDGKTRRGCARPIATLIAQLESGDLRIGLDGEPVHVGAAAANPLAAVGGGAEMEGTLRWHELDKTRQRAVIDNQRLAYLDEMTVNWCPALGTVLANDEVIDGKSERGGHPVLRKPLRQWQFRITSYAQRLLDDLALIDWPASTRTQQEEWIGRSEGAEIDFPIEHAPRSLPVLRVFTTRPDTIFGATYMVVAPEHPIIEHALTRPREELDREALRRYVETSRNKAEVDRMTETREKTGVFTGMYCTNPATGKQIPIWTADYVLMGYGTGAIMAVPAHDERDWAFAKAFNLPIVEVIRDPKGGSVQEACFSGDGVGVNSANAEVSLNGLSVERAKAAIIAWLEKSGLGVKTVNYRLRDWVFSRQRYWGEPIPIVFDEQGNHYPVGESALPVVLPDLADYSPVESEEPQPLLAKATEWVHTTAGAAGVSADVLAPGTQVRRETNTMPGSAGSSWYFLRYCDAKNPRRLISREADAYWMGGVGAPTLGPGPGPSATRSVAVPRAVAGVDLYIGGPEHAVGHLLYSRFWQKALFDLGEVCTPEPFNTLFHQGMITSYAYQRADKSIVAMDAVREEADGRFVEIATGQALTPVVTKMSKRYKNVINPDDIIAQFGADTFRLYEMYMGPLEASKPWNTKDTIGCFRFLQRAWRMTVDEQTGDLRLAASANADVEKQLHRTIAKVDADIPRLAFNTAIAAMIEFVNAATGAGGVTRGQLERFALILSPFAPHMAEELWARLGHAESLAFEPFPMADPKMLVDAEVEIPISIQGKVRHKVMVPTGADKAAIEAIAMGDPRVKELIAGKTVQKVIVVPGKMVNLVIG
ncbi:MAG TPA: class I tRNA ligase family protein [Phycisphaerales bacterium]|nr:class I tRNA ligase family protein [Phycisphaerales bacterium]